jgi:hypothetical protein
MMLMCVELEGIADGVLYAGYYPRVIIVCSTVETGIENLPYLSGVLSLS